MWRLLIVLVLVLVTLSGCIEQGPNAENIKTLALKSASNLSSYSFTVDQKQIEIIKGLNKQNGTYDANVTSRSDETNIDGSVNLARHKAMSNHSTKMNLTSVGGIYQETTSKGTEYNIGNTTYLKMDQENWTQLKNPPSEMELWSSKRYNNAIISRIPFLLLLESINRSNLKVIGEEKIDGYDTYKLSATIDNNTYYQTVYNLISDAIIPFVAKINSSEINKKDSMETTIWIEKGTYLPRKYESHVKVEAIPVIVGFFEPNKGQVAMFNKSIMPAEVSVESSTLEHYYNFDISTDIIPPKQALETEPKIATPIMAK
jgi:outer membrane lipoprotein-sorting protein